MEAVQVNWPRKMSRRRGQRVKKSGQRERERKRISHKPLSEQEGTPNNTQKRVTEKRAGNLKKFTAAPPRLVPYLTSLIFIDNRSAHLHNSCILLSKNCQFHCNTFSKVFQRRFLLNQLSRAPIHLKFLLRSRHHLAADTSTKLP